MTAEAGGLWWVAGTNDGVFDDGRLRADPAGAFLEGVGTGDPAGGGCAPCGSAGRPTCGIAVSDRRAAARCDSDRSLRCAASCAELPVSAGSRPATCGAETCSPRRRSIRDGAACAAVRGTAGWRGSRLPGPVAEADADRPAGRCRQALGAVFLSAAARPRDDPRDEQPRVSPPAVSIPV